MKFLLDTNLCIAVINGKSPHVEKRMIKELSAGSQLFVSTIAAFELWYGVAKSYRREENTQRLKSFLVGWTNTLAFDEEDARIAGRIRAETEAVGKPVGAYDLLIAGQALRHQMTLVTANVKEFGRVKSLIWEDWSKH